MFTSSTEYTSSKALLKSLECISDDSNEAIEDQPDQRVVNRAVRWLAIAQADRNKYVETTLKYFEKGQFGKGLSIYDSGVSLKPNDRISYKWQELMQRQAESNFPIDATAFEDSWCEWIEDDKENKIVRLSNEIQISCYFALFKYIEGDTEGAVEDINDSDFLLRVIKKANPLTKKDLSDDISKVVTVVQKDDTKFSPLQNRVLNALASNPRSCQEIFKYEKEIKIIHL
jgi:hypothetical protein